MATFVDSANDINQEGGPDIFDVTVTLDNDPPTSGNLLVLFLSVDKASGAITNPTGWTLLEKSEGSSVSGAMWWKVSDGTDGSETISFADGSISARAVMMEFSGLDSFDASNDDAESTESASKTSGTTATLGGSDRTAVACWCVDTGSNTTTGQSYSNSFVQDAANVADDYVGITTAYHLTRGTAGAECTFSFSDSGDQIWGCIAAFYLAAVAGRPQGPLRHPFFGPFMGPVG